MFGLYSDFFFQAIESCFIFKIEASDFMKLICRDDLSYKHYY